MLQKESSCSPQRHRVSVEGIRWQYRWLLEKRRTVCPAGERQLICFLPFPSAEVCGALNVTVSPGPVVDYLEGENATLLCHVSQKRRKDSLLAVRWFFASPNSQEALMVKMTKLRVVQYYGNYSRSAFRQRLCLLEERQGALYTLSVLTLQPTDQGHYVCKVQEISKYRNKWTAWSNGSSATEMRGKGISAIWGEKGGQMSGPPSNW